MYCVPAPNVTQEKVFYCRSLVKTREFPLQAFANDFIGTSSTSMNIEHHLSSLSYLSGLLKKENLDLLRARHLIAENLIYLKEFTFAELGTIQAQLRAETLRIHTVQDKFAANWAAEHPSRVSADKIAISDEISESESIDSRDSRVRHSRADSKSFSRPRSRANSWSSRCDSQSSLLGRLTASVLSLIDSDSHKVLQAESFYPESPCGCGIIWEGKSLEKVSSETISSEKLRVSTAIMILLLDIMLRLAYSVRLGSFLVPWPMKIFYRRSRSEIC